MASTAQLLRYEIAAMTGLEYTPEQILHVFNILDQLLLTVGSADIYLSWNDSFAIETELNEEGEMEIQLVVYDEPEEGESWL
jgi:hypothetical protein